MQGRSLERHIAINFILDGHLCKKIMLMNLVESCIIKLPDTPKDPYDRNLLNLHQLVTRKYSLKLSLFGFFLHIVKSNMAKRL